MASNASRVKVKDREALHRKIRQTGYRRVRYSDSKSAERTFFMTKSASAGVFARSNPSSSWRRGCPLKCRPTPRKGVPGMSPQPPKLRRRAPKLRRWEARWRGIVKCASKRNFPRTEGGQPPIPAPKTRERAPLTESIVSSRLPYPSLGPGFGDANPESEPPY